MSEQTDFPNREGYGYARFLLQEKQRELQALKLQHLSLSDYRSCRRSLLQAISQLETLLRADPKLEETE